MEQAKETGAKSDIDFLERYQIVTFVGQMGQPKKKLAWIGVLYNSIKRMKEYWRLQCPW